MNAPPLSCHALRSLARALLNARAYLARRLDPALREEIILHVSSVNSCTVCSVIHGARAHQVGLSDADIAHARDLGLDGWDPRTQAASRYAALRTTDHEREHPEAVAAFERAFSPEERAEIRAVVDFFTFANRFNNTWERLLPGAAARRRRTGIAH